MPVESIYLLNVVVKQEVLIKTQNKTGDVLLCYMQQSSIHYTLLYIHSLLYIHCIDIIHKQKYAIHLKI